MEFKFCAYHPDEMILAADFLHKLAELQHRRLDEERKREEARPKECNEPVGLSMPSYLSRY